MNDQQRQLIAECKRQEETCLYTSTTFFEWLKALRWWRIWFVIVPIILGAIATLPLLTKNSDLGWLTGICALAAGVIPAAYKALDFDVNLENLAQYAHRFKILQDRFRQAWTITAAGDLTAFEDEFKKLMDQLDEARASGLTAPECFFEKAKKKIERGDYGFAVDTQPSPNP